MTRSVVMGIAIALFALAGLASGVIAAPIQTENGLVEGTQESDTEVFKGVPFAAAPVGDLRWRAPKPAPRWLGIRKADRFSSVCTQHGSYPEEAPPEPSSEDCLYLNVWVPHHANVRKLPVMVWIYGGSFQNGAASTPLYSGDMLAWRDVIVVTANYRLGVFGFLSHPDLTKESPQQSSGNYGLLDQIAALRWVKQNEVCFNG